MTVMGSMGGSTSIDGDRPLLRNTKSAVIGHYRSWPITALSSAKQFQIPAGRQTPLSVCELHLGPGLAESIPFEKPARFHVPIIDHRMRLAREAPLICVYLCHDCGYRNREVTVLSRESPCLQAWGGTATKW